MPEPDRPVLTPAGLKHPRVREFLAVKRRPASRGLPCAVTLEGERRGLAREWLAAADSTAAIPMLGNCDSLNAAVAGALLLYQALAQDDHNP
jgi:RNA methyltransferase, TrmH family